MAAPILVGTSNWADHERFYPPELEKGRRQRDKLTFYARHFLFVEIDTTFYGIPKPSTVQGWVELTPPDFRFNVKALRALTRHEREGARPRDPTDAEAGDCLADIAPWRAAGTLMASLSQIP